MITNFSKKCWVKNYFKYKYKFNNFGHYIIPITYIVVHSKTQASLGLRMMSRKSISPFTRVCLSVGEERARTLSLGQILSILSCSIYNTNTHTHARTQSTDIHDSV